MVRSALLICASTVLTEMSRVSAISAYLRPWTRDSWKISRHLVGRVVTARRTTTSISRSRTLWSAGAGGVAATSRGSTPAGTRRGRSRVKGPVRGGRGGGARRGVEHDMAPAAPQLEHHVLCGVLRRRPVPQDRLREADQIRVIGAENGIEAILDSLPKPVEILLVAHRGALARYGWCGGTT